MSKKTYRCMGFKLDVAHIFSQNPNKKAHEVMCSITRPILFLSTAVSVIVH